MSHSHYVHISNIGWKFENRPCMNLCGKGENIWEHFEQLKTVRRNPRRTSEHVDE